VLKDFVLSFKSLFTAFGRHLIGSEKVAGKVAKSLYIFGGDSTALEIAEAASARWRDPAAQIFHVVPDNEAPDGETRISIDRICQHAAERQSLGFILSMPNQDVRASHQATAISRGRRPVTVIHPRAFVSPSAQIGEGVYIAAFAVVSSQAVVHDHVMINFQALVGHHGEVCEHAVLNPGAKIGGRSFVGPRTLVGAVAFVHQGKRVGEDVVIDALTYVDRDIESGHLYSCRNKNGRPIRRPFFGVPSTKSE